MSIKVIVMDVDGTLTDGKIYMGCNGEVCKAFNIKDGYGIHDILIPAEITPIIITGRKSDIVENRCRELGIKVFYQGVADKSEKLKSIITNLCVEWSSVAYIGDDLNDLPSMMALKNKGGLIGCPKDAVADVKTIADHVCTFNGGDGAVREFIEWIVFRNENERSAKWKQ